jgi:predicted metal-dependent HD superfamily phosphohydrolase
MDRCRRFIQPISHQRALATFYLAAAAAAQTADAFHAKQKQDNRDRSAAAVACNHASQHIPAGSLALL